MTAHLSSAEITSLQDTAHKLADAAREAILPYFRADTLKIASKDEAGFDPVTQADRAAESAMRELLAVLRPDDAILGEEYGTKPGTTGFTWILDPIDGTRGFLSGTPVWGVLIGVTDTASNVVMGVIDQPYIGERFWGGFGQAQMTGPFGERALAVRGTKALESAILFSTFPEVGTSQEQAAFQRVASQCKLTRYGCDCYAHALLAAGQIDLVIEAGLHSYDIVGPIGVIEAAGGIVTNWQGASCLDGGQVIAAATPELHAAALELLAG
ncbi:MAG: histidinol-phosphatase [Pseudomonadota bacterium]